MVLAACNLPRLEEVAKDIKSRGDKANAIQTDISEHEQIKQTVAQAIDEFGQIDILVNNAAFSYGNADVVDMSLDNWHNIPTVNLTGTMLCS